MSKPGQGGQFDAQQINAALAQIQGQNARMEDPTGRSPTGFGARLQQYGQNFQANAPSSFQQMAQRPAYVPPMATTDPNLAANMEQLSGLLGASRDKKMMLVKALTGGG